MTKIIGISGRKQAGKNTLANYINGSILKKRNMVQDFYIDDDGQLAINTEDVAGNTGYGILDVTRKDETFTEYARKELWPYVKVYHFADYLKEMSINLFNLKPEEVYGNDDKKNTKVDYLLWENMPENAENKSGSMTNREFLEHFGTKIIRKIKTDAWVHATIQRVLSEKPEVAVIPDVRFPNEVEAIQNARGFVIRLKRDIFNSDTESEAALDPDRFNWSKFDCVIDNSNATIANVCDAISKFSFIWGV